MTYNLFISHSWSYGKNYDSLVSLLNSNPYFYYRNYSVPKDDPIHNALSTTALELAIERQILPVSVVLVLAGVYSTYSKWINIEIEIAQRNNKPIIGVEPWGSAKTSSVVRSAASAMVGWNSTSVISAIRQWA